MRGGGNCPRHRERPVIRSAASDHWATSTGISYKGRLIIGKRRDYTIQRGSRIERAAVGIEGKTYDFKQGKDGHYTNEGQHRRAIEHAVAESTRR